MASASPIKFRCFECSKLLGVSRSKVGMVVSCPQCGADLIVPDPAEPSTEPNPPEPRPSPSSSRIEPVVVPWDAPPVPEPTVGAIPSAEPVFPAIQTEPLSLRPDPPARTRSAARIRTPPTWSRPAEPGAPAARRPSRSIPAPNCSRRSTWRRRDPGRFGPEAGPHPARSRRGGATWSCRGR